MSDETHVLDLLPAYALGSLEGDEATQVEAHLVHCVECRAELSVYQSVNEQLVLWAPGAEPAPHVRDRLLERARAISGGARAPQPVGRRPWLQRLMPAWGVASTVLILALGIFNLALWQRLDRLQFATAPGGMRAIPLSASDAAPGATGFVLIGVDGNNGALVVDRLPPLGEGWEYQVWLVRDGTRSSGALFATDEEGYRGLRIEAPDNLLEYAAVEVTIEPAGGSPQPTGERVLGGPLFTD